MKSQHPLLFFLKNALISLFVSAVFVSALLFMNVGNLRSLVFNTDYAALLLFVLTIFMGISFSLIQFEIALFLDAEDEE